MFMRPTLLVWIWFGHIKCNIYHGCPMVDQLRGTICKTPHHVSTRMSSDGISKANPFMDDVENVRLTTHHHTSESSIPQGTVCKGLVYAKDISTVYHCWRGQWRNGGDVSEADDLRLNQSHLLTPQAVPMGRDRRDTMKNTILEYKCEVRCNTGWWHHCQNMCWTNRRKDLPPTIRCHPIKDTIANGMSDTVVLWDLPTAIDHEDGTLIPRITQGPRIGSALGAGNYLVVYEAKDSRGQVAHCSFTFNVLARHCPNTDSNSLYFLGHGSVKCTNANLIGSECTFACDKNYELKGQKESKCQENRKWSVPKKPLCALKRCPSPGKLDNAIIKTCPEPHEIGAVCHVQCHDGFQLVGDDMTCKADRTWSKVNCVDVTRPAIKCPEPMHEIITEKSATAMVSFGLESLVDDSPTETTSNYESGHSFASGKYVVVFTVKDNAGNVAKCAFNLTVSVKSCPLLEQPYAITVCSDSNYVRSTCQIKCIFGNEVSETTCQEDGTWSSNPPECSQNSCGPPAFGAEFHCPDGYGYGSVCRLVCPQGSDVVRFFTITCLSTQSWSTPGACIDNDSPKFLMCPKHVVESNRLPLLNYPQLPAFDRSGSVHYVRSEPKLYTGIPVDVVVEVTDSPENGNKASCKFQVLQNFELCDYPYPLDTSPESAMIFQCGITDGNVQYCDISCWPEYKQSGSNRIECHNRQWVFQEPPVCSKSVKVGCKVPYRLYRGNITEYRTPEGELRWTVSCYDGFLLPRYLFDNKTGYFYCNNEGKVMPMRITESICRPEIYTPVVYFEPRVVIYGSKCYDAKRHFMQEFINSLSLFQSSTYHFHNYDLSYHAVCSHHTQKNPFYYSQFSNYAFTTEVAVKFKLPKIELNDKGLDVYFWKTMHHGMDVLFARNVNRSQSPMLAKEGASFRIFYQRATYRCEPGRIQGKDKFCASCGRGSRQEGDYCYVCPRGTYQQYDASVLCKFCPIESKSENVGLMSESECKDVDFTEDFSKDCARGSTKINPKSPCKPCPVGSFQFNSNCVQCPEGRNTVLNGSSSESDCKNLCSLGSFSRSGLEPCYPCQKGQYADEEGLTSCKFCPLGTWTEDRGANRRELCLYFDLVMRSPFRLIVNQTKLKRGSLSLMMWVNNMKEITDYATQVWAGPITDGVGAIGCGLFSVSFKQILSVKRATRRTWHHLALVYSNNVLTLYVDGREVDMLPADFPNQCDHINFKGSTVMPELMTTDLVLINMAPTAADVAQLASQCGQSNQFENLLEVNGSEVAIAMHSSCDATDNCASGPCGEHAICIDVDNDYFCNCTNDYMGQLCKTPPNWCSGHQCQNSRECINDHHAKTYKCNCMEGFSGKLCESRGVGEWSEWSEWEPCHQTCGEPLAVRRRECLQKTSDVVASCNGESTETMPCETTPCPINGGMSKWLDWTCISDDKGGQAVRVRKCNNPEPQFGGDHCWEHVKEYKACKPPSYRPVNGAFGPWSDWSPCGTGVNLKFRVRLCENPAPMHGGYNCSEANSTETSSCLPVEKNGCWKLVAVGSEMKRVACQEDKTTGMMDCHIDCKHGFMVDNDIHYLCGPLTNYTWSHINKNNPRGLLPHCSKITPVSVRSLSLYAYYSEVFGQERFMAILLHDAMKDYIKYHCPDCSFHVTVIPENDFSRALIVINKTLPEINIETATEDELAEVINSLYKFEFIAQNLYNTTDHWSLIYIDGRDHRAVAKNISVFEECPEGSQPLHGVCAACGPGTYWKHRRCLECPVGFYQPFKSKSCCFQCPPDTNTAGRGAFVVEHCVVNVAKLYPFHLGYWTYNKPLPASTQFDEVCGAGGILPSSERLALLVIFFVALLLIVGLLGRKYYQTFGRKHGTHSSTRGTRAVSSASLSPKKSLSINLSRRTSRSDEKDAHFLGTSV